jgi:hypothetical protein
VKFGGAEDLLDVLKKGAKFRDVNLIGGSLNLSNFELHLHLFNL